MAWLPPLAGPVLIVASVLAVLHDVAFGGMVSAQHPDLLAFWLPNHCFLGQSLAAGHVPAWNPHTLGGVPFVADPQSGWLYLPAMALYALLPCHVAVRWFLVLQPVLAGLGLSWFLRTEGLSRPAATLGGVALAMAVSGSLLAVYLPFSATFAWTAVLLATASRLLRVREWPGRLGWLAATALAWGQLASAHPTNGLALGTAALAVYAGARLGADVRRGRRTARASVALVGLLLGAMVAVNLGIILPRLAYLPRTTMGIGFERLDALARSLSPAPTPPIGLGPTVPPTWPLQLALWPGLYVGAATLLLAFAGWSSLRRRALLVAFAAYGAVTYLLSLGIVARALAPVVGAIPFGDLYLHSPWRFRLGLVLALPVLAALGADAWREARGRWVRPAMLAPALIVFGILPILVVGPRPLAVAALGGSATLALLAASARWSVAFVALPVVLAVELGAGAVVGQARGQEAGWPEFAPAGPSTRPFTNLLEPDVDVAAYMRAGPVAEALGDLGTLRFVSIEPSLARQSRGILLHQEPSYWGLMGNGRAMLFGLEESQGYNPVQLLRYWSLVRAANAVPIDYNAAVFVGLSPAVRQLLHVDAAAAAAGRPPEPGARQTATEGSWAAYALPEPSARASVVTRWTVRPDARTALDRVLEPGFDPAAEAILEDDPGISPSSADGGTAIYRPLGPQAARVDVVASAPSLVVIRNIYDPGWRATVDGRPASLLVADALIQAVPVPEGSHTVVVSYDDPWTGYGLTGSGLALAALIAASLVSWGRRRAPRRPFRRRRSRPGPAPGEG